MTKCISSVLLALFLISGVFSSLFAQSTISFQSNHEPLNQAFVWAKEKALSFAHDSGDPVGPWYEAALPNREAFCMRDVSHQAIGAELLGLGRHNLNMFQKFAQNISAEQDYCSYWEINRYDKPAPVDYENDRDFWYNLPANFDVVYNAWRLYQWTGDPAYLDGPEFRNFYALSMNEYVDHWDLGAKEITARNRDLHSSEAKRFGSSRGIPTYNEGGRGKVKLGIDLSASLIAAYQAYSQVLAAQGNSEGAAKFQARAQTEQEFLEKFWWDSQRKEYRSIQYEDGSFDYFMVEDNQAYLHYLLYFGAIHDQSRIQKLTDAYLASYPKLIVELKSYLPIIFYENGYSKAANEMLVDLCSPENARRDYPENSYTVIEHVARGLMGIEPDAATQTVTTLPRLASASDWAELKEVPVLSGQISVKHEGLKKTTLTNLGANPIQWSAGIPGDHAFLWINGAKVQSQKAQDHGRTYSFVLTEVKAGEQVTVLAD
ncbi:hypothetical protein [Algoriphagus sp. A40]|uniref:hypothetical protein n=1 Tax=Algoriphagus sp. A40 TaxID=1945863 RepID=UPI000985E354|nr:hypothetical protein [Algoriphagus sp. A40]OOG73055.1 hypothetical protein B0E43_14110 [Algoriphagus sp. A40]